MTPDFDALRAAAEAHGQGHIFRFWDRLDERGAASLLEQVAKVDFGLVERLVQEHVVRETHEAHGDLRPADVVSVPETADELVERRRVV